MWFPFGSKDDDGGQSEQSRQSFRMKVDLKAELFGPADPEGLRPIFCRILNLSGGGALLKTDRPFGKQVVLRLKLWLPCGNGGPLLLPCYVVRTTLTQEKGWEYRHAVRFLDPTGREADQIVEYLFSLQRKDLKSRER